MAMNRVATPMWIGADAQGTAACEYGEVAATTASGQFGFVPLPQESTVCTVAQSFWQLTDEKVSTERAIELGLDLLRGDTWTQSLLPSVVHCLMTASSVAQAARALGMHMSNLVAVGAVDPASDLRSMFGAELRDSPGR
eukprot:1456902-Amphidinium_carterae.1